MLILPLILVLSSNEQICWVFCNAFHRSSTDQVVYLLKLDALPVFIDVMFTCPHELRINVMMCIINTLSCFKKNPVELSPLLLPHVQAGEHSELLLLFEELKESRKASGTRSCSSFWSLFSLFACLFAFFFCWLIHVFRFVFFPFLFLSPKCASERRSY